MKPTRVLGACLLATTVLSASACDDDDDEGTGPTNTATVRVVNTTGQALDVGTGGTFGATSSNIGFGASSACLEVPVGANGLTFRQNGQAQTFSPAGFNGSALAAGGNYTLVIGGAPGAFTANTFTNTYAGATTQSGAVRVVNATTGSDAYNLYVGASGALPATANQTNFGAGTASTAWFPIAAGQGAVRLTTGTGASQTTAFESAAFPVTANQYQTLVIANPAAGASTLRAFTVASCR